MLKKHVYIHTGEKNYSCDICNRRFTQPSGRNTHRKTHFKVKTKKNHEILDEEIND